MNSLLFTGNVTHTISGLDMKGESGFDSSTAIGVF
jgi:hypothetical protein